MCVLLILYRSKIGSTCKYIKALTIVLIDEKIELWTEKKILLLRVLCSVDTEIQGLRQTCSVELCVNPIFSPTKCSS